MNNNVKDINGTIYLIHESHAIFSPTIWQWHKHKHQLCLFTCQAQHMSNYLRHLLTKQLIDIKKSWEAGEKIRSAFFYPILKKEKMRVRGLTSNRITLNVFMGWWCHRCCKAIRLYQKCTYSTWSWFNHNTPAVDSLPRDCLQDLTWLLYFVDNWELDENNFEWNEVFNFPKHDHDHDNYAASHRIKWALIEDAYVKRWQDCVKFGNWVTADKSRLAECMVSFTLYNWTQSKTNPHRCNTPLACCNAWEATIL